MLRVLVSSVVILLLQVGCTVSNKRALDITEQALAAANKNTEATLVLADVTADTPEEKAIVDRAKTSLQEFAASQRAEMAELRREIEQERQKRIELVNAIAGIVAAPLPGGSTITSVVKALGDHISNKEASATQAAEDVKTAVMKDVNGQVSTINDEIVKQGAAIKTIEKDVNDLKNKNQIDAGKQDQFDEFVKDLPNRTKEQQEALRSLIAVQISGMSAEMKAEFAEEYGTDLVKVMGEMDVAQEEIDKVKNMEAGDVLEKYGVGGAGGIAGLIALARTFGKSRSKEDLEKLAAKLDQVNGKVDQVDRNVALNTEPNRTSTSVGVNSGGNG